MDPVTAIGLLASLCSLIEASNSLRKVIKSFREGEKEIQELCNDVAIFEEALKGFDRILRSRQAMHNISGQTIDIALQEAFVTVQNMEKRLLHISSSEVLAIRRLKWVQHKPSLKRLHERLKEQSAKLQSFLTMVHAFVAFHFLRVVSFYSFEPLAKHFSRFATGIRSSFRSPRLRQTKKIVTACPFRAPFIQKPQLPHREARYSLLVDHLWILPRHLLEVRQPHFETHPILHYYHTSYQVPLMTLNMRGSTKQMESLYRQTHYQFVRHVGMTAFVCVIHRSGLYQ